MEVLWEVEYWSPRPGEETALKNRVQRRPLHGVPVRRLDHVNLMAAEVTPCREMLVEQLGFRLREQRVSRAEGELGAWLSVSALSHEIAFMRDRSGSPGRFHHVAFWYGYPQHLYDIADVFNDRGVRVEHGPGKHGISQALFLYCYEPGGNRVELFGDTGYLILDPDWKPVRWTDDDDLRRSSVWIGAVAPLEFHLYGTPDAAVPPELVGDPLAPP